MLPIGLNHMTVPQASVEGLFDLALTIGAKGVELRNDLGTDPFGGLPASTVSDMAKESNLRILAVAEVSAFNDPGPDAAAQAQRLAEMAQLCGSQAIALIPKVTRQTVDRVEQRRALRDSLLRLQPILEDHDLMGFIEPLGFANSSLRRKQDAVAVLDDLGRPGCFAVIHDTFHHHLSGEVDVYPELTALVHISGVADATLAPENMADCHRGLIDSQDQLDNTAQLRALVRGGYRGPASFEAFASNVHNLTDPASALARSIEFIASEMAEVSA